MPKQLNVDLSFSADTSKAKGQIQDLQNQLTQLMNTVSNSGGALGLDNAGINAAVRSAAELKAHLNAATNVQTGKLDFSKLNASLSQGKKSLSDYADQLYKLGPQGQQAFMALTNSVANSEIPIRRINSQLTEMGTVLKNTIKWQISSSLLHGFMGAISSANRYAQDLNESLNNIRIVTGYNTDQMAKFAEQANKAAKALSTTTTEYTNASLIYYQQGLSDAEVQQRTDVTIKMANVARQSATVVSDQLTAIWNNFYDGSKSLEYYADVMTALGAATASSTDEIAGGLEKFAAIGETIGLSYEYAASALATITSNTRQSEEVVGTALKTIFARIQGLNLGETLDDGTSLNKYSQALQTVGISIFESNGELKKMDSILDELGAKWDTIGKAEQTALAQTVAGVRQYTQLIALMENWDNGDADSMQANLETSYNASGALEKQADIYAESWEAARDRVAASAEAIYGELLDDDMFIGLLDGFSEVLDTISSMIDALGGLKGVLFTLGALATRIFGQQIAQSINNAAYSIKMMMPGAYQKEEAKRTQFLDDAAARISSGEDSANPATQEASAKVYRQQLEAKRTLIENASRLSDIEKEVVNTLYEQAEAQGQVTIEKAKAVDEAKNNQSDTLDQLRINSIKNGKYNEKEFGDGKKTFDTGFKISQDSRDLFSNDNISAEQLKNKIKEINKEIASAKDLDIVTDSEVTQAEQLANSIMEMKQAGKTDTEEYGRAVSEYLTLTDSIADRAYLQGGSLMGVDDLNLLDQYGNAVRDTSTAVTELSNSSENFKGRMAGVNGAIKTAEGNMKTWADGIVSYGNMLMSFGSILSTVKGTWDTLNNPDASGWEKVTAIITGVSTALMMLSSMLSKTNIQTMASITANMASAMGFKALGAAANAAAAGTAGFGATLATVFPPILIITAVIAALVGTVMLLVEAFKAMEAASINGQIKQAEEGIKNFKDRLEEAKNEANDLRTTFDQYDSVIDKLEECTKGTEAWTKALQENNTNVLGLLRNYPKLATLQNAEGEDAISKDKDGVYKVADWARDQLEQEAQQKIFLNEAGINFFTQRKNNLQYEQQADEVQSDLQDTLLGQQLGWYSDSNNMAVADEKILNYIQSNTDKFINTDQEGITKALHSLETELGVSLANTENLANALYELQPSIEELDKTEKENAKIAEMQQKIMADSLLSDNELVQGSKYRDEVLSAAGRVLSISQNTAYEEMEETGGVGRGFGEHFWNKNAKKAAWAEYAEAAGLDERYIYQKTSGWGENKKYHYYDPVAGQDKTISANEMQATIATNKAQKGIDEAAEKLTNIFLSLAESADKADQALLGFLSEHNFEGQTRAEYEAMVTKVGYNANATTEEEQIQNRQNVTDYLAGLYGGEDGELNDEDAQAMGFETAEKMIDSFLKALTLDWGNIQLPKDLVGVEELSFTTAEKFQNTLKEMNLGSMGSEGGRRFIEGLNTILDDESPAVQQKIQDIAMGINWSDWNAGKDFKSQLKDIGVQIDMTDEQWNQWIEDMREANNAFPNFETISNQLINIHKVVKDIDLGSIIEEEEYQRLVKYNEELAQYFLLMADGTYKSLIDQEKLQEMTMATIEQDIAALKERADLQQQLQTGQQIEIWSRNSEGQIFKQEQIDWGRVAEEGNDYINLDVLRQGILENETYLSVLNEIGYTTQELSHISQDEFQKMAESVDQLMSASGELTKLYEQLASTAEDFESLNDMLKNGDIDLNAYYKAWTAMNNEEDLEGLDTEELDTYAEYLEDTMDISDDAAEVVAKSTMKMNRGIDSLAEGFKDWSEVLKESSEESQEFAEALDSLREAMSDLLDINASRLSKEFLTNADNMKLMEQAAKGSAEAIDKLKTAALKDIVMNIEISADKNMTNQQLWEKMQSLQSMLDAMNLTVGMDVDDSSFIKMCNDIIEAAGLTADDVNAAFDAMGFEAAFSSEPQEVQGYNTLTTINRFVSNQTPVYDEADPKKQIGTNVTIKETATTEQVPNNTVVSMFTADIAPEGERPVAPKVKSLTKKPTGSANNYSSSNKGGGSPKGGGGGGSPAKKLEPTKKQDVVERYKEVTDALDDVADAMQDVSKISDRMYGKSHISALQKQNELLQDEIKLLQLKKQEAQQYLAIDRQALSDAAAAAGVTFQLDERGNIANYTEQMNALYEQLNQAETYWNQTYQGKSSEDQSTYQEEVLDPLNEKIDTLKEAISQYDETRELIEDIDNELDDKFYEWQDNNYEILHYTLEIELELNDLALQEIEYYLDKIADDFYSMAEGLTLMNDQIPIWTDSLGDYETFYNGINQAYANGEISQAKFVEGLKESYSGILETLTSLNELDDEMMHYYEDTLAAANEELSEYTDHLEHLTSVLDHYKSIVELVNGEFDYDRIGTILEGQATTLKNELITMEEHYKRLLSEKKAIETAYNSTTDAAARELLEEELKAITAAVDEAQDAMLSKTEEWAEAMKAVMENTIASAGKDLENAFTMGMGFDSLMNSLDRINTFQDEYLTKTNQIYETQKMMRTAQQAADKTDSQASKVRLKAFIDETQQLQNKNQMSKLDLEIQQAKYDLLLAEIALEDAQNAKSTVRLQRDNEGNFGYVYTADGQMVSEKEQELLDAENALYNIGLEAANDYGQKRLELQQQLADELISLNERRNNGEFETDALYYAERDRILAEYTDLFTAYSEQYTTALGVDNEIQRDAWIMAYDDMIDETLLWKDKTTEYLGNCEDAYANWRQLVADESDIVNDVLNGVESNVKDITTESSNLAHELVGELIPALNNQLSSVRSVTSAYAAQRGEISALISYYERLAASIRQAIAAQAAMDNFSYNSPTGLNGTVGGPSSPGNGSPNGKEPGNGPGKDPKDPPYTPTTADDTGIMYTGKVKDKDGNLKPVLEIVDLDKWQTNHFATGGLADFTGPAWLDGSKSRPELVLNPEDTKNFLSATEMLRTISHTIDLQAMSNQVSLNATPPGLFNEYNRALEQMVTIEANFPAVQDRNEIEAAFNNLINTASQYANRK